jgi:hypothetical protein
MKEQFDMRGDQLALNTSADRGGQHGEVDQHIEAAASTGAGGESGRADGGVTTGGPTATGLTAVPYGADQVDGAHSGSGGGGGAGGGGVEERVRTLLEKRDECARLRDYIDKLVAEVRRQDEAAAAEVLDGLPALRAPSKPSGGGDDGGTERELQRLSAAQLEELAGRTDGDMAVLEEYVDKLLENICEHCPTLLETSEVLSGI